MSRSAGEGGPAEAGAAETDSDEGGPGEGGPAEGGSGEGGPGEGGPDEPGAPVALALGSNLGDRLDHLAGAVAGLAPDLTGLSTSSVYESDPVGYRDQPAFLNAVVTGATALEPEELLARGHALEEAAGRRRSFPDAPRPLDVDIVLYGTETHTRPSLRIPHPRFRERAFVLAPLAEIAPGWVDPHTGRTVLDLWTEVRDALAPARVVAPPEALRRSPS